MIPLILGKFQRLLALRCKMDALINVVVLSIAINKFQKMVGYFNPKILI